MKGMILCAGFGTRLGELTRELPKPMLLLDERPLLEFVIMNCARHGVTELAVNLHFMPEMIRGYFGDGAKWGTHIAYSHEDTIQGTAGALKKMTSFLSDDDMFLVHYGDILTNQDLSALAAFHRSKHASATLLLHQRAHSNSIVRMDEEHKVVSFLERPNEVERQKHVSPWVFSGVCACSPEFLDAIPADVPCDIPRDILPMLIPSGRVYGFPLTGYRCAIDSPERLSQARKAVSNGLLE
jgi:NDP-sugar pyrophosphorylase family protein